MYNNNQIFLSPALSLINFFSSASLLFLFLHVKIVWYMENFCSIYHARLCQHARKVCSFCMQDNYMYVDMKKSDFNKIEGLIKVTLQL